MNSRRHLLPLLLACFGITLPLLYFGLQPMYFADVLVEAPDESRMSLNSRATFTRVDADGVAFFDFVGSMKGPVPHAAYLDVRPHTEADYRRQLAAIRASERRVHTVVSLGSKKWPLHQSEQYAFRLVDDAGSVLLIGTVRANVHAIAGGSQAAILAIGLFAAVLQVAVVVWPNRPGQATTRLVVRTVR